MIAITVYDRNTDLKVRSVDSALVMVERDIGAVLANAGHVVASFEPGNATRYLVLLSVFSPGVSMSLGYGKGHLYQATLANFGTGQHSTLFSHLPQAYELEERLSIKRPDAAVLHRLLVSMVDAHHESRSR